MSGRPNKRVLEAARRERATRKRERKEARADEAGASVSPPVERDQAEVIAELDALHRARDAGDISLEDFETTRAELLAALAV